MENDFLYTDEDLYAEQDHQAHIVDFYTHVATECGYGSQEWIERCKYQ